MDQPNATSSESSRDKDLCKLHLKVCKIFCLNCSTGICGVCVLEEQHDLHQFTNLTVVYRESRSNVESKLVRAEEKNDELRTGSIVYQRNLELLEEEKSFIRQEIKAIAEASKLDVANMTSIREKTLREKLERPTKNAKCLLDLRKEIEQMSANEFMHQCSEIARKCDDLIGAAEAVTLESVDDIECGLISPYQFETVIYQGFSRGENNQTKVFSLKSAHDVEWKLTVKSSTMVQLQLDPSDPQLSAFRHVVIVIIPHSDYSKHIRRTFELDVSHNKFDVVQTSHIAEQGLCSDTGDLVMKIGIRPLNAIVEKELLAYQYGQQKDAVEQISRQLHSIIDNYDYNHLTMHFKPKLSDLREKKVLYSFRIRDDEDRQWCMILELEADDIVMPYIKLFRGSAVTCSYFVELKNKNGKDTAVRVDVAEAHEWKESSALGWNMLNWKLDQLSNDTGFNTDGYLHFRFGVRTWPNICESPISCAANA